MAPRKKNAPKHSDKRAYFIALFGIGCISLGAGYWITASVALLISTLGLFEE